MNRLLSKSLKALALASSVALLASCGTGVKPLTSTPPAKGLKVTEFTWGDGILLKKYTFPTAVYEPQGEDKKGYYYYPQNAQVKAFDSGLRYGVKGGIYWKKDLPKPANAFVTNFAGTAIFSKKEITATPVH